jgi:H+-transporting ATPase
MDIRYNKTEKSVTVVPQFGLTTEEARKRLGQGGANAIADLTPNPMWRAVQKLWAPVPWMLEAAILLQLVLGEYVEAGVVTLLLVLNAGLSLFQEGRAKSTLEALKPAWLWSHPCDEMANGKPSWRLIWSLAMW